MEGIGLSNMLGADQVEKLFSDPVEKQPEESGATEIEDTENNNPEETAEVDFSDLLGNQPESVGSEGPSEGTGGTPESHNDTGTPYPNLFASFASALRDEGVFPDLSDESIKNVTDAASFKKLFDDEVSRSLNDRQKQLEKALNNGATSNELQQYQSALSISDFLNDKNTYDTLVQEGKEGEDLRRKVMYQDYVNKGFTHERAVKLIEKSFADGADIDDAKESFQACKDFYSTQIEDYQNGLKAREAERRAAEEKQYANLKKHILDTDSFFGGVQVDKNIRQKAYDAITKPVFKTEDGNYMTALQQYQYEHPAEFMEHVAMLYSLTDGFKNVDKLVKKQVKAGVKKGFEELANVLNTTRRNGDGTLNLANTSPDDSEREKWTLAI